MGIGTLGESAAPAAHQKGTIERAGWDQLAQQATSENQLAQQATSENQLAQQATSEKMNARHPA